jgi:hypothetical protein
MAGFHRCLFRRQFSVTLMRGLIILQVILADYPDPYLINLSASLIQFSSVTRCIFGNMAYGCLTGMVFPLSADAPAYLKQMSWQCMLTSAGIRRIYDHCC